MFAQGGVYAQCVEQFFSFVRIWLTRGRNILTPASALPNDVYLFVLQRGNRARLHGSIDRRTHDNWIVNSIKRNGLSRLRKRSRYDSSQHRFPRQKSKMLHPPLNTFNSIIDREFPSISFILWQIQWEDSYWNKINWNC